MLARHPSLVVTSRNRRRWVLVVAALAAMLIADPAFARDMTGKIGVGMGLTGQSMPLAVIRYWRTKVAFELMVGWQSTQRDLEPVSVQAGQVLPPQVGQATPTLQAVQGCITAAKEIGAAASSTTNCSATLDLSYLRLAVGVLYRIADGPRASLSLGLRPWLQTTTQTLTEATVNRTAAGASTSASATPIVSSPAMRWGVEIPLVGEAFLTDNASFYGQIAFGVARGRLPEYPTTSITSHMAAGETWLGTSGSYAGGAGFCYYF